MHLTRRDLLKSSAIAGAGLMLPGIADAAGISARVLASGRILVLVELDGGNDGLNTVIPYADPNYIARRPTLRYSSTDITNAGTYLGTAKCHTRGAKNQAFASVDRDFGLHPDLHRLMEAWHGVENPPLVSPAPAANGASGDLAIVLGVGYATPNLSHFRSIDIWNSGSNSNQFLTDGWLGRVLANNSAQLTNYTADAVLLERYSSNPLALLGIRYLAMESPQLFIEQSLTLRDKDPASTTNAQLAHLLTVQRLVFNAAASFRSALATLKPGVVTPLVKDDLTYTPPTFPGAVLTINPKSSFELQCLHTAEMIATANNANKVVIPAYKLHLGGFDNHASQRAKHLDLLAQLGSGLASLRSALKDKGLWDKVVVMTYSEFGRRVEENGSAGTDHGTSTCHFIMGGQVNGGFYGKQPGLVASTWNQTDGDLDERGNLLPLVDYRHLYQKVVDWMGFTPDAAIATPPQLNATVSATPLATLFKP